LRDCFFISTNTDSSPGILACDTCERVPVSTSRLALHCAPRTKVNMCFAHLKKNREKRFVVRLQRISIFHQFLDCFLVDYFMLHHRDWFDNILLPTSSHPFKMCAMISLFCPNFQHRSSIFFFFQYDLLVGHRNNNLILNCYSKSFYF